VLEEWLKVFATDLMRLLDDVFGDIFPSVCPVPLIVLHSHSLHILHCFPKC
jgi:hypothetical protein